MDAALTRFRVMAYVTGVGLLVLCAAVVLEHGFGVTDAAAIPGTAHGIFYMGYLVTAFDLAFRRRWKLTTAVLILIAGTIPICSFLAERKVVGWVRAETAAPAR